MITMYERTNEYCKVCSSVHGYIINSDFKVKFLVPKHQTLNTKECAWYSREALKT